MAKEIIHVEKLQKLKLKSGRKDHFCPPLPFYEYPMEGLTGNEFRNRDQRNEQRKVDWENECLATQRKAPMVARIP